MPPTGRTPLHLACRWGRVGAIKALVQAGADVNRATKDGRMPAELLKIDMSPRDRNEILKLLGESLWIKIGHKQTLNVFFFSFHKYVCSVHTYIHTYPQTGCLLYRGGCCGQEGLFVLREGAHI